MGSDAYECQQVWLESEHDPEPKPDAPLPDAAAVQLADAEPGVEMRLANRPGEGEDRLEERRALIFAQRPDITLEALR